MKKIATILTIILMWGFSAYTQPGPDNPGGEDPENPVPITGIEYLLAAGAALGFKKLYDKKKKEKQ